MRESCDTPVRAVRTRVGDATAAVTEIGACETTYTVPDFWGHAAAAGLEPRAVTLVPRSDLDERYAYLSATRPAPGGPPSSRS